MDKYNPIVETLVSMPLINLASWDVAINNATGLAGVTVGTDDWRFPTGLNVQAPVQLYGAQSPTPSAFGYQPLLFKTQDRVRVRDVTLHCNFADGLVDISPYAQSPAPGTSPFPSPVGYQVSMLTSFIQVVRVDSAKVPQPSAGSTLLGIPFGGFGLPSLCDLQEPRATVFTGQNITTIAPTTDLGYYLIMNLDNIYTLGNIVFSTLSIDPVFQKKRVLVWATVTVVHTYPMFGLL